MTMPRPTPTIDTGAAAWVAAAIVLFLAAATVPYSWLIAHFGYDDILREPTGVILANFHAGGAPLVLAWFGFAMSALLFIPVALGMDHLLVAAGVPARGALVLGVASAVVQAIGLLRWVLVVPGLAAAHVVPSATPATREAVTVVFDAVHHYGGMVVGEMTGQLLLAGWTGLVARQLYRARVVPRAITVLGALTLPLWLIGQTELLHEAVPAVPAVEVIPFAFMGWELWLAALAVALAVRAWRQHGRSVAARTSPTAAA